VLNGRKTFDWLFPLQKAEKNASPPDNIFLSKLFHQVGKLKAIYGLYSVMRISPILCRDITETVL